jgi:hypothetical protein
MLFPRPVDIVSDEAMYRELHGQIDSAPMTVKPRKAHRISADSAGRRIGHAGIRFRRCLDGVSRIEAQRLSSFRAQATREGDFFGE